jgi:Amt family ammonium transporter
MTTTLATAVASFTWAMLDTALRGKPGVLGFCSGGGRAGRNYPGVWICRSDRRGAYRGCCRNRSVLCCTKLKSWLGYDDALDTFGIHAVGGTLGAFLTGVFATATVNPNLSLGVAAPLNPATQNGLARIVGHTLWLQQLKAIVITILLAVVASAIIGAIVRAAIGLRIAPEIERQGSISMNTAKKGITS